MSFLKNWLLGLILAIPLLCSPWIVETLQAKGRLNAINIDSVSYTHLTLPTTPYV